MNPLLFILIKIRYIKSSSGYYDQGESFSASNESIRSASGAKFTFSASGNFCNIITNSNDQLSSKSGKDSR